MKQISPAHAIVLVLELISLLFIASRCQPQPVHGDTGNSTGMQPVVWIAVASNNYAAPVLSACNSVDNNCGQ